MNIVQITPGAGDMYCGNCFRDNALVAQLRRMGHHALMVPLYLPLTLDEASAILGTGHLNPSTMTGKLLLRQGRARGGRRRILAGPPW